jgi:branched-chain amino acid transport system permease protein
MKRRIYDHKFFAYLFIHSIITKYSKLMDFIVFSLLNGILYGLLLFMLSSGLTLIFGMMGVLNFAHASFYMAGAYVAYQVSIWLGFWPALVVSLAIGGLLGALVERYGLRQVHRHGHMAELLFTFGLAYLIVELVKVIWGKLPVDYKIPKELDFVLFSLFTSTYTAYRGFMMLIAVGMFIGLYLMLTRTRTGIIIRAALANPVMVGELGHNVPLIFMAVFGVGCAMAGLGGAISGNLFSTEPGMAERLGTIVFVVVIVGGLGSLTGALIASILIGLLQTFAAAIDHSFKDLVVFLGIPFLQRVQFGPLGSIKISQTAEVLPYLFMVLMLLLRPKGLMGTRET